MVQLLKDASRFSWNNYSVPRHDPAHGNSTAALKRQLINQMQFAHVILVLAGVYASHSGWIQFEMDKANEWGKPILGVRPWGSERMSSAVRAASDEIVGWNTSSIVSAVRRLA
jgi:hypothetical protein